MNILSAEELDLLSFFEVEPERIDSDIPWPYNHFTYRVQIGQYSVVFGVAPSFKDLSLEISYAGEQLYNLTAVSFNDLRYHKTIDSESLEINLTDRDSIFLRLRPNVTILQSLVDET